MLLILVQQVIEDLPVEEGDTLEVIVRAWLKAYYFINESIRLVRQVSDVLLSLHLLLHICRIIANLKLNSV